MSRYGPQFGPDITFLGVPRCDLDDPASYADAKAVIVGAPFDGGTSYRSGARFGPQAIRMTDYLPHDGSRPSLALRTDALRDLKVVDAGDVEMYSGDIRAPCPSWRRRWKADARRGDPGCSRRRPFHRLPDAGSVASVLGHGRVSTAFRRPRRHRRYRLRVTVGARPADAATDRVGRDARRPLPAHRTAWLLAAA